VDWSKKILSRYRHLSAGSEMMRRRTILSIVESPVKSGIIRRLASAGKAAYTDLLETTGIDRQLGGTGAFNYHLRQLERDGVIGKRRGVYRLTGRGRSVAGFLDAFDRIWRDHREGMDIVDMDVFDYAKDFQELTGIVMDLEEEMKGGILGGDRWVLSQDKLVGVAMEESTEKFLGAGAKNTVELDVSEMRLEKRRDGAVVLSHPKLGYQVSPFFLGAAQLYLGARYRDSHVYADPREGRPFIVRAKPFGERYTGCAMLVSPYIEDEDKRPHPPKR